MMAKIVGWIGVVVLFVGGAGLGVVAQDLALLVRSSGHGVDYFLMKALWMGTAAVIVGGLGVLMMHAGFKGRTIRGVAIGVAIFWALFGFAVGMTD